MNKARLQFCSGKNQSLKCTETAFTSQFLRCIANAKDFNKAGEIHCKGFVSTGQAASVEISKLPKAHPKTWRNNDRVISVALWGSIGDEHDTNDTTVKYIPDKYHQPSIAGFPPTTTSPAFARCSKLHASSMVGSSVRTR